MRTLLLTSAILLAVLKLSAQQDRQTMCFDFEKGSTGKLFQQSEDRTNGAVKHAYFYIRGIETLDQVTSLQNSFEKEEGIVSFQVYDVNGEKGRQALIVLKKDVSRDFMVDIFRRQGIYCITIDGAIVSTDDLNIPK